MKPLRGLSPIAHWLMRFGVAFFILTRYWNTFTHFNLQSVMFYVSALFIVFGILLFIGGFLSKSNLTVVSSLVLVFVTGYHAFLNIESKLDHNFAVYVILGSIFVYFLTTGNKRS